MLVVGQHAAETLIGGNPGSGSDLAKLFVLNIVNIGFAGVVAFFGISGFVVPSSLGGNRPLYRFSVSRVCRLFPAFWPSVFTAVAIFHGTAGTRFPMGELAANLTMIPTLWRQPYVLGVYWTLPIELAFYSVSALAFYVGIIKSPVYLACCTLTFLGAGLAVGIVGKITHHHFPGGYCLLFSVMHFGTLLRVDRDQRRTGRSRLVMAVAAVICVAAAPIIYLTFLDTTRRTSATSEVCGFYIGFGLFLLCIYRQAFDVRPLVFLGSVSYSLYLFHPVIIELVRTTALASVGGAPTAVTGAFIGSILVAWAVFKFVEKPAIRLSKRIVTTDAFKEPERPKGS